MVAAGAIPPLVALLGTGSTAALQEVAACALRNLALSAENQAVVASAGAIPHLVALLGGHQSTAEVVILVLMQLATASDS